MPKYIIEAHPNPTLQPDIGYFHHGQGTKDEPFHFVHRRQALEMNLDFAKRRADLCRSQGHRARILTSEGHRVIVDWGEDLVPKEEEITRFNQHRYWDYRGLRIIEDRATGKFHHRWAWPIEGGPERSVTSDSCEGIIARLQELGGDVPDYLAAILDKAEAPQQQPMTSSHPGSPTVKGEIPTGRSLVAVGWRPGNTR